MYMTLFEEREIMPSGNVMHVVSAICRIKDANAAAREWQRDGTWRVFVGSADGRAIQVRKEGGVKWKTL